MNNLKPPEHHGPSSRGLEDRPDRVSLSRSPHPYHRRGDSLSQEEALAVLVKHATTTTPHSESTESGTEADDEKGPLLKGLPAPPPRLRKGLRGSTPKSLTPSISPLPTPPAVIQQELAGFFDAIKKDNRDRGGSEDRRRTREYIQRKSKEIVRRGVETALLASTYLLIWTTTDHSNLEPWHAELLISLCLPLLLYIAYPIRKSQLALGAGNSALKAGWLGFHIPSKFDPGPLLYPVILPVIISMSVLDERPAYLPANLVCALSSIPERVTAIWGMEDLMWQVRWIVTVLPFHLFRPAPLRLRQLPLGLKLGSVDPCLEDFVLLFPLHQSLKSVLESLTTTSLDPTELELLTSGMINVFVFAQSPQAQLLKSIVWVGGLSILLTCRHLLAWEVALARIPKWRFARQPRDGSLSARLKRAVQAFTAPRSQRIDSSDDEVDERIKARPPLRVQTLAASIPAAQSFSPSSPLQNGRAPANGILQRRGRRNTFSVIEKPTQNPSSGSRRRRRLQHPPSYFLTLSAQQALLRSYGYAGIVYMLVISALFGPVWYYVATRALSGAEPLGWALGYAFGNIPVFRHWVQDINLGDWVKLPSMPEISTTLFSLLLLPGNIRLLICGYCLTVLLIGIIIVLSLTSYVEVDTRRKVFHGVMVAMLLPTIFADPCFLAMALSIILAAFLILDLFRASQLPPISRPLTNFLAPYTDGRDHRGPVIVSHIFLLIGCAIPLWLSLAGIPRTGEAPWAGWEVPTRNLSMISGVVCVGMGDAAASLIGRRYGRTKWYWAGGKSLEGSLAFACAATLGLMFGYIWLRIGGWASWEDFHLSTALIKCIIAGSGASLLESVLTAANDNVVVPIGLWLLVRGLKL